MSSQNIQGLAGQKWTLVFTLGGSGSHSSFLSEEWRNLKQVFIVCRRVMGGSKDTIGSDCSNTGKGWWCFKSGLWLWGRGWILDTVWNMETYILKLFDNKPDMESKRRRKDCGTENLKKWNCTELKIKWVHLGWGGNQELNFGHDNFEMSIRYASGDIKSAIGSVGLESKGEVGLGNILYVCLNLLPKSNKSLPYLIGKKQNQSKIERN